MHKNDRTMGKDEWLTPPSIFKSLQPFDLDPCEPISPPWHIATKGFNKLDNGLSQEWFGFVWCNPPYGGETHRWLSRMKTHNNGIAMIFARTDTETFQDFAFCADAILFIKGRVKFYNVDGKQEGFAGAPSCLVAYGQEAVERLSKSNIVGKLVLLKGKT